MNVETVVTVGQLILTIGAVLGGAISWVRNGIVAQKFREGIGLDVMSERLDSIHERQRQTTEWQAETKETVKDMKTDVQATEKGLVAIALAVDNENIDLSSQMYRDRFLEETDVSVYDFVDGDTRGGDGDEDEQPSGPSPSADD